MSLLKLQRERLVSVLTLWSMTWSETMRDWYEEQQLCSWILFLLLPVKILKTQLNHEYSYSSFSLTHINLWEPSFLHTHTHTHTHTWQQSWFHNKQPTGTRNYSVNTHLNTHIQVILHIYSLLTQCRYLQTTIFHWAHVSYRLETLGRDLQMHLPVIIILLFRTR